MRLPGRLWFRAHIGGADWQVRVAAYSTVKRLAGRECEAVTDIETHAIFVPWELTDNPSRLKVTLCHELIHAACSGPGEVHRLSKLFGCSEDEYDDREEDFCVHFAPLLVDALGATWRLPKPPKRKAA